MLDLGAIDRIERATGGAATSVWRVDVGARRYALRVFQAHERHVLDRELMAMAAARRGGVPVPRVHAVGTYDERPALLLEWCNGQPLCRIADPPTASMSFASASRSANCIARCTAWRRRPIYARPGSTGRLPRSLPWRLGCARWICEPTACCTWTFIC